MATLNVAGQTVITDFLDISSDDILVGGDNIGAAGPRLYLITAIRDYVLNAAGGLLAADQNLADLDDAPTARANLDVPSTTEAILAEEGALVIYRASGGDDTSGINNALSTVGVGTVLLVDAAYSTNGTITLGNGQRIQGMGFQQTVITASAGNPVFLMNNAKGASIADLEITGTATKAITIYGGDECMVDRVLIEGTASGTIDTGIYVYDNSPTVVSYYIRIHNCKINRCASRNVQFLGTNLSSYARMENCNIGGDSVSDYGIYCSGFGLIVVNTDILATKNKGFYATTSLLTLATGITLDNVGVDTCGGSTYHGIHIDGYGYVELLGCWSSACGADAILLEDCDNYQISDTIAILAQEQGIHLISCDNGLISNCIGSNNNAAHGSGFAGLVIDGTSSDVVISGGRYTNSLSGSTIPSYQEYAIILGASVTGVRLGDDVDLTGNTSGELFFVGSGSQFGSSYTSGTRNYSSALALTTFIDANVTSITLGAGVWEVAGCAHFIGGGTTTVSRLRTGLSTTSAVMPADASNLQNNVASIPGDGSTHVFANSPTVSLNVGPQRFYLASATTVYLVAAANFGVSTCSVHGFIRAKRLYG